MTTNKKCLLILSLCLSTILVSCSDKDGKPAPKPESVVDYAREEAMGYISVLDQKGNPLAGAKILIGNALNKPFQGNFLTTNEKGQIMAPAAWTEKLALTVQAQGFTRVTHLNRSPGGATFRLNAISAPPTLQVAGVTSGHNLRDNDGMIDVGMVMTALTRQDILAFDLNKIMSSRADSVAVVGQKMDIPSNISIPRQRENYVISIKLEKPNYRLFFSEEGPQRVFAAHGRFPFRAVVEDGRAGKPFHDLINHFSLLGGSIRDLSVKNGLNADFAVNEIKFTDQRSFKAPALGSGEVLISMAVADLNGWLIPTDVKKLKSNESRNLSIMSASSALALGVLKNSHEFDGETGVDRLSAVVQPFAANGANPEFMSLIPDPDVISLGQVRFTLPQRVPAAVNPIAMVATLSEIKQIPLPNQKPLAYLTRLWEVQSATWMTEMNLPEWPEGTANPLKKRWEVAYIGSDTKSSVDLGGQVVESASHVTHSSKDF